MAELESASRPASSTALHKEQTRANLAGSMMEGEEGAELQGAASKALGMQVL